MTKQNAAQIDYWNEQAGRTWAELQPLLDQQLERLGAAGIAALAPAPGEAVLDVGCGCGGTTLDIARHVAPGGRVLGFDLSRPMLEVAERRAAGAAAAVTFLAGDAQTHAFADRFDAVFSRFGVMFFEDPVAAFANIRTALRPGGRLAFVCWRDGRDNAWMNVPLRAALRTMPPEQHPAPDPDPHAPGPFAFADPARVGDILARAGFTGIATTPYDTAIGGFGLDQALELALRVGPLGKLLRELPAHRQAAVGAVRDALAGHTTPQGVYLGAAVWIVTARRSLAGEPAPNR